MAIHTSKKDASSSKRDETRRTVVSLEDFAHRKADGKAIAAFRERKERKRLHTAQALRKYKKFMKQEGYEAGHGASRKRYTDEEHEKRSEEKEGSGVEEATQDKKSKKTRRHHKTTPFRKEIEKAQQQRKERKLVDPETRDKERKQKLRERRQRTKILRQKTSKGQPIMKNLVHDILAKLEKEKRQVGV